MPDCPECGASFEMKNMEQGEIFTCSDCGIELEVISLDPPKVKQAPMEEEDWGE